MRGFDSPHELIHDVASDDFEVVRRSFKYLPVGVERLALMISQRRKGGFRGGRPKEQVLIGYYYYYYYYYFVLLLHSTLTTTVVLTGRYVYYYGYDDEYIMTMIMIMNLVNINKLIATVVA